MVRMKRFTFFILYIILFQRVFGDTLVTGTVFHRVTNQPIGNVNVYIDNSEVGTSTQVQRVSLSLKLRMMIHCLSLNI